MLLSNDKYVITLINQIIVEGKVLIEEKERRVKRAFNSGFDAIIYDYKTKIINSGNDVSEIGHYAIKQGYDIGFVWRQIGNKIGCSLRSNENIDVSKIARSFGGGGHKNAAGINFDSYQKMLEALEKMYHGDENK
jgi:nanoRNase/pAp phosphatase (c-di-AMP/oligoRNAs hydrolase)